MGIILQTAACNQLSLKMLNAWNCFTTESSAGIGSPDLEDVVEIEGVEDPAVAPLVHEGYVQTEEIDPARNVLGSLQGQELGTVHTQAFIRLYLQAGLGSGLQTTIYNIMLWSNRVKGLIKLALR